LIVCFDEIDDKFAGDDPFNPGKSSFYRKPRFFSTLLFYSVLLCLLLLLSSFYLFFSPGSSSEGFTDETSNCLIA
jgi:hypothetical protein